MKLIKRGKLHILIDFSTPIIANHKQMLSNNKKGGILLKYKVKDVYYVTLFGFNIPLYPINRGIKQKQFFRPLKSEWNRDAFKISKIYWGRKNYLLTNLWLEVDINFKDIYSVTATKLAGMPHATDKQLIKKLNFITEKFILSI